MRIFWAIIAVLTIAALAAWFTRGRATRIASSTSALESPAPAPVKRTPTPDVVAAAEQPGLHERSSPAASPVATVPLPEPAPAPKPPTSDSPGQTTVVEAPAINPDPVEPAKSDPALPMADAKPEATQTPKPTEVPPEFFTDLDAALHALVGDPAAPNLAAAAGPPDASKPAVVKPVTPAAPQTPLPPAKIVPQPDGSVMIDDKYPLKGKGTKDDPYRMTWDQLVSAERTYQPRLGRKQIPERVKMLDGKWIRIGGFIAFPLMAQSADEMLMMLNQWDGCCIGVPPTPYDAIEVKLKKAVKGDDRLRATGTLTGILRVDPYLVKDWLVSLYVMDDGELSDLGGEAPPPPEVHGK